MSGISPVLCSEPGCRWAASSDIPEAAVDLRARCLARHRAEVHVAGEWALADDVLTVLDRLAFLLAVQLHQPAAASKGRHLVRLAVYGRLWRVDRIGDVPLADRLRMRTLAGRVVELAYPGGAYAGSVSACQVKDLAREIHGTAS